MIDDDAIARLRARLGPARAAELAARLRGEAAPSASSARGRTS